MNTKQIMLLILKNTVLTGDHGTNWSRMIRAQMMVITEDLVQHMELALRNSITKVKSASRIRLWSEDCIWLKIFHGKPI